MSAPVTILEVESLFESSRPVSGKLYFSNYELSSHQKRDPSVGFGNILKSLYYIGLWLTVDET
jgi:hypothetical protein